MHCSPACEQKMPTSQFVWKLRASRESQQNTLNFLLGRAKAAAAYPLYTSAKSAIGGGARPRRLDSNFDDNSPLSLSEAFSRAFATPSVFGPACCQILDAWRASERSSKGGTLIECQLEKGGRDDTWSKWIENTFSSRGSSGNRSFFREGLVFHCFKAGESAIQSSSVSHEFSTPSALKEAQLVAPGVVLESMNEGEVSSCPKGTAGQNKPLTLVSGACYLPHPDKQAKGGEDAHFICDNEKVVGVADGVGGWADVGVDAGQYARELMSQAIKAAQQEPHGLVDPARILVRAHSRTKCKGSSTACILALSENGLQAANLGDSGFIVVRNGKTVFKTPFQQHLFNIPYQLEDGGSDPPTCAQVFTVQVAAGDVIVAGTDGLFDNVFDSELAAVVMQSTRGGFGPQMTAERIAAVARSCAQDRNKLTPFQAAAQDAGYRFYGGKMDDITVVVSFVTSKG